MGHLLIPFVADIHGVSEPKEIAALGQAVDLDRRFAAKGPLINRFLMQRVVRVLMVSGGRLPSITARDDEIRKSAQRKLQARLDAKPVEDLVGSDILDRLAELVCGNVEVGSIGPATQQAIGRLFSPGYEATNESWDGALTLDKAVRSRNPVIYLGLLLSGRLRAAKRILSNGVNGDLAGVHATGIAVHNFVHGLVAMRSIRADDFASSSFSEDAAAAKCIFAPPSVLRQALVHGRAGDRDYEPGTLFLLNLEEAYGRAPSADMAFGAGAWSQCPALNFVPALLRSVWRRASMSSRGGNN